MKRLIFSLALGALLAIPAISAADPKKDFANGNGEIAGGNFFHLESQSDAAGGGAKGHFDVRDREEKIAFWSDVQCLRVVGNRAEVIAVINKSKNSFPVGSVVRVRTEDNGKNGNPAPDELSNTVFPPGPVADAVLANGCQNPLDPASPIFGGDVRIDDN
jgi:hypothetical protein